MKSHITKYAIINSVSTGAYVVLVGLFFNMGHALFGNKPDTFMAPIFMLMLLVFSAALCGSLVFGRPILWYLDGKKKEAVELFIATIGMIFILAIVAFIGLFLM